MRAAARVALGILLAFGFLAAVTWRTEGPPGSFVAAAGAALAVGIAAWLAARGYRRGADAQGKGALAAVWRGLALYGIVAGFLLAGTFGVVATYHGVEAQRTVEVTYEASIDPAEDGVTYLVRIPAATHVDDWVVSPKDTEWRLETTARGRALVVEADRPVDIRASTEIPIDARDLDEYRLTMGDLEREDRWNTVPHEAYRAGDVPVEVSLALDVAYGQGAYEYRMYADLATGWEEYNVTWSHPHGDGDWTFMFLPAMFLVGPVLMLVPLFVLAVIGLGVHALLTRDGTDRPRHR